MGGNRQAEEGREERGDGDFVTRRPLLFQPMLSFLPRLLLLSGLLLLLLLPEVGPAEPPFRRRRRLACRGEGERLRGSSGEEEGEIAERDFGRGSVGGVGFDEELKEVGGGGLEWWVLKVGRKGVWAGEIARGRL